jgi:hypothetical protein
MMNIVIDKNNSFNVCDINDFLEFSYDLSVNAMRFKDI